MLTIIVLTLVLALAATGCEASAQSATGLGSGGSADFLAEEGVAPFGANDPACRPDADHPPVVLVHGTFSNMFSNFSKLSPALVREGYCVYALNYGDNAGAVYALGDIRDSARELDRFVNDVLAYTGEDKVSIVGHSQGGMMPRYYIKNLGGKGEVEDLVGVAPPNHGTELPRELVPGAPAYVNQALLGLCKACTQQGRGSAFLRALNTGDETPGAVDYTVIATETDTTVVPYTSGFVSGPAEQATNITLQDYYPNDPSGHLGTIYDPNVYTFIFDALWRGGPAQP